MKTIIAFIIIHFSFLIVNYFAQQPGWEVISSGTTTELSSIFFYDYEVGFAVGDSGTVLKSIDSGKTWQVLQPPTSFDLNDLYMFHRDTILVVGDSGTIYFSDSGGVTWSGGSNYIPEDILSTSYSSGKGICGCSSQAILICTYTGTAHYCSTAQTGFFGGGFWGAYMLSPQIGFVAGENSIFQPLLGKTTDSGINWGFIAFYLNSNEGRATGVDFTDMNTGYVSARVWDGTGAISKTADGGNNWTSTMFSNPLWSVDFPISGASQVGYSAGDVGTILKTYNAGANWQQQNTGTSLKLNKVFFLDLDNGFAVGKNGIILRTTSGGEPVVDVEKENQAPLSFELFQNYPNPFNSSTTIAYNLEYGTFVSLIVYDCLGENVKSLVNEFQEAGTHRVVFESDNLPSGLYFLRIIASPWKETKKMVLLK